VILGIMLIAPLCSEKMHLPGIVGLILAGVIVGPNGLGLLARDHTIVLLDTVGLLFLMFMAGLETSLDDMKHNADKALIFRLLTFAVPMILGTGDNVSNWLRIFTSDFSRFLFCFPYLAGIIYSQ
jgi:Kef-type K+ transport system membrane component KefB